MLRPDGHRWAESGRGVLEKGGREHGGMGSTVISSPSGDRGSPSRQTVSSTVSRPILRMTFPDTSVMLNVLLLKDSRSRSACL